MQQAAQAAVDLLKEQEALLLDAYKLQQNPLPMAQRQAYDQWLANIGQLINAAKLKAEAARSVLHPHL